MKLITKKHNEVIKNGDFLLLICKNPSTHVSNILIKVDSLFTYLIDIRCLPYDGYVYIFDPSTGSFVKTASNGFLINHLCFCYKISENMYNELLNIE